MELKPIKGRGAISNPHNRYAACHVEYEEGESHHDGASPGDSDSADIDAKFVSAQTKERLETELLIDHAKTIIATNRSPDVPFEQSINPYKGCEHGCIYCFARPTHAYWDLSPGLDFETKIFYKPDAPALLEKALQNPRYRCKPIGFGTNTDPYQPIDKALQITRKLLLVLQRYRHPFSIVTKGSHIERDLDILQEMASANLCSVFISITTLDNTLKRQLEPRASSAHARLKILRTLKNAGVPVGVLVAPVIPMLNDNEIEKILFESAKAGAETANFIFLRLPREVKDLFYEWLRQYHPLKADRIIQRIRDSRGGVDNVSQFGARMRGQGVYAELISKRFHVACRRFGLNQGESRSLDCTLFRSAVKDRNQLELF